MALVKAHEKIAASPQDNADTPRWVHIVFSAPNPNRLFSELKSRGASPYTHGNNNAGPLKRFLIKDSEGNEIEIVTAEDPRISDVSARFPSQHCNLIQSER